MKVELNYRIFRIFAILKDVFVVSCVVQVPDHIFLVTSHLYGVVLVNYDIHLIHRVRVALESEDASLLIIWEQMDINFAICLQYNPRIPVDTNKMMKRRDAMEF